MQATIAAKAVVEHARHQRVAQGAVLAGAEQLRLPLLRARVETEMHPILGQQREVGLVVRNDAGDHGAQAVEHVANVERAAERGEEFVERFYVARIRAGRVDHSGRQRHLSLHPIFERCEPTSMSGTPGTDPIRRKIREKRSHPIGSHTVQSVIRTPLPVVFALNNDEIDRSVVTPVVVLHGGLGCRDEV
jgi:hypothetical protein